MQEWHTNIKERHIREPTRKEEHTKRNSKSSSKDFSEEKGEDINLNGQPTTNTR